MTDSNGRGREETEEERADRQWSELLQELRVAQTGVQILFGFLPRRGVQPRFANLSEVDRDIYVVTVVLGSATVAALVGTRRLPTGCSPAAG
ncbi:Integral membrane protein OS=Streptomyces microflavus OX=1919 GN=G3I39_10580 PE=4 SV=1 [Streptomyces microflavus]